MKNPVSKHPSWIRGKISWGENFNTSKQLLRELRLNSVCVEGACPNKGECWEKKHITFLILGDKCTRGCSFCNVSSGALTEPDINEPANIVRAVGSLGCKYVVITSVTRDDLPDGGSGHFIETVKAIKEYDDTIRVELLIPDLNGKEALIKNVSFCGADVIGHNVEMPEALYGKIRPRSNYRTSLRTLEILSGFKRKGGYLTKSNIILGLGEKPEEISRTLQDLRDVYTDIVYMGQYLSPTDSHWEVRKYYTPEEFRFFGEQAQKKGFKAVCSGPMVRSSYLAEESFLKADRGSR